MSPDEAADFVEGYRRRGRQAWERHRIGWWLQVADAKGKEMREIFPFDWDARPKKQRVTQKQREELRRKAAVIAQKMREAKTNGKE